MAIDVGPVCADKGDVWDITLTIVSDENAANDTGTIDYLCTFLSSQGSNVEVASFAHAGSNVLSTNGTASLGTVATGSQAHNAPGDFTAFNINTGEFIGIYGTAGDIECDTNGASGGAWYKSGDYIPATSETFSQNDNYGPALYGTGTAGGVPVEVTAGLDSLVITEYNPTVFHGEVSFTAGLDALAITEYAAGVNKAINLTAGLDALVITEYNATVKLDTSFTAGLDVLTITEFAAVVKVDISFDAGLDVLAITEHNAVVTVDANVDVTATLDALILTEFNPVILAPLSVIAGLDLLILTEYNPVVAFALAGLNRRGSSGLGFSFRDGWR